METHQSIAPRHYGTEEDIVLRLREILFFCRRIILGELYLSVTLRTELLEGLSYLLSGNVGPSAWWICRLSLSVEGERGYKDSQWKWASGYRGGRSPDHSLSDRSLSGNTPRFRRVLLPLCACESLQLTNILENQNTETNTDTVTEDSSFLVTCCLLLPTIKLPHFSHWI